MLGWMLTLSVVYDVVYSRVRPNTHVRERVESEIPQQFIKSVLNSLTNLGHPHHFQLVIAFRFMSIE